MHSLSSPSWAGGLGLVAGGVGLAIPVQAGLAGSGLVVEGSVALAVLLTLHGRFVLEEPSRRAGAWWLVAVQAWLTYVPLAVFGPAWTPVCGLLAGALLVVASRIRSVVLVVLALSCGPVLLAAPSWQVEPAWALACPLVGVVEFALLSLLAQVRRLAGARTDVMRQAVTLERRRFTRDLHDLVGHRLTVLTLKARLIQRLVAEGDEKARQELTETLDLLRELSADVRAVAHGRLRSSSLAAEMSSARALLESARVRCQIRVACRDLHPDVEEALTHALREGVTNVLRHAEAGQCWIQLMERDNVVRLSIRNDGVRPPRRPGDAGQGLLNLAERVSALGGWLEASTSRGGQFSFSVYAPRR
ncbi:histidine kinase [Nonomuraea sp. NPDC049607]|uniref:sensor histidine kinase n=1 Tax=unclassified Nonomuraea TaxID=2593643 RepID=UPI00341BC886